MDIDKLTIRSQAALQEAHQQAAARHHQTIEPEHVLLALLSDPDGIVLPLLHATGANPAHLRDRVGDVLDRMPKVYTQGAEARISTATGRVLETAARERRNDTARIREHASSHETLADVVRWQCETWNEGA